MIWQKRSFQFSILLLLAFVWGSSFILMKIGLKSFSLKQAGALRIGLASLALPPDTTCSCSPTVKLRHR